ncbi:hypothetical protein [Methylobacterium sp. WL8]|uniref:hypothetical protein n=1 Tax=Methylobacterium sp. WL8 TaxID=2603899 RepID=UPI001AEE4FB5|nr:hypothetical protein [Methylobacterium sp. WL8]
MSAIRIHGGVRDASGASALSQRPSSSRTETRRAWFLSDRRPGGGIVPDVALDKGDPRLARVVLHASVDPPCKARLVGSHRAFWDEAAGINGEAVAGGTVGRDHARDGVGLDRVEQADQRGDAVDHLGPGRRPADPRRLVSEHREGHALGAYDGEHQEERETAAERVRHQPQGTVLTSAGRT